MMQWRPSCKTRAELAVGSLEEKRTYNREYYARNREAMLLRQKERDAARVEGKRAYNRERSRQKRSALLVGMKAYYEANKDERRVKARENYRRNKARYVERAFQREGRLRHGALWTTPAEQAEIDGMYQFCSAFPWFEVDHIVPLNGETVSGLHVLGNLQVLSRSENRAKRNKFCPAMVELVQNTRS